MKNQWDDFDYALATSLSELPPPEETIQSVTPFRDAVSHIVLGLCLTCFTLNFWYLQYLFPLIGSLQLYFGFRTLRSNNRWFRISWYLSICKVIILYINCLLLATPFQDRLSLSAFWGALSGGSTLALFLCFHLGLTQAAREVGQTPRRRPALWATVWYAVLLLLALAAPDVGLGGILPMIAAFVCIVRSLLRTAEELATWGYGVRAAPVRYSTGRLSALYLSSLLVLILLCSACFNHLPADGSPVTSDSAPETFAVRTQLTELGFPAELLSRLPEEEIAKLSSASRCEVHHGDSDTGSREGVAYFHFDTVYVRTGPRAFRVYEFFDLRKNDLHTSQRILVRLEPQQTLDTVSDVTGRIAWTRDNVAYVSAPDIVSLPYQNFFTGPTALSSMVFSYPFFSKDQSGYMAYSTAVPDDGLLSFSSVLRAKLGRWQDAYPYQSPDTYFQQSDIYAQSYTVCRIEPDEGTG